MKAFQLLQALLMSEPAQGNTANGRREHQVGANSEEQTDMEQKQRSNREGSSEIETIQSDVSMRTDDLFEEVPV